ncbi:MAG: HTTM domain-containing protein, partial [Maribacter sp.]
MLRRLLFQRMDNSPLIIFRIFFGILISLECFGAIATGWVRRNLVAPTYHFPFIDFEWLQPLPGSGMYFYFAAMGLLGIFIALGWKYRISIISFTLLWTGVYLMQKTAYNNHYYLLVLICFLMCFLPANRSHSL